jgi:hypothetical protein
MTITRARNDEEPMPGDLEPEGFLRLMCADTGDCIELQADQLAKVRHWQLEGFLRLMCADTGDCIELQADQLAKVRHWQLEGPPGWVRAVGRYGDVRDFWWPSIRIIDVITPAGRERSIEIESAHERDCEARRQSWD